MKWQKAITRSSDPRFNERQLWVKIGPPVNEWGADIQNNDRLSVPTIALTYETNVRFLDGHILGLQVSRTELLPEFADDVPILTWQEFLAAVTAPESPH